MLHMFHSNSHQSHVLWCSCILSIINNWRARGITSLCQILGCFIFYYFCLGLPNFRHVSYKLIGKHLDCVFFSLVFSSFSRNNIPQKDVISLLAAFFAVLLLREKQKKPFVLTKEPSCFSSVFSHKLFLENEEKTSGKNTEKFFPIH